MNVNDREPNFRWPLGYGRLFLVRCFACEPERGRENWVMAVSSGVCVWCQWTEEPLLPGFEIPQDQVPPKILD